MSLSVVPSSCSCSLLGSNSTCDDFFFFFFLFFGRVRHAILWKLPWGSVECKRLTGL